jgi:hypothetical protein
VADSYDAMIECDLVNRIPSAVCVSGWHCRVQVDYDVVTYTCPKGHKHRITLLETMLYRPDMITIPCPCPVEKECGDGPFTGCVDEDEAFAENC